MLRRLLPVLSFLTFAAGGSAQSLPTRLTNLSVRAFSGTGDRILIVGYALTGTSKPLLVRAVGPSLAPFGVTDFIADPQLAIFQDSAQILSNDNWSGDDGHELGAFTLPAGSKDSVVQSTFQGRNYTAQANSTNGSTGEVLVEVYDGDPNNLNSRLINLSSRTQIDDGQILIVGMTLTGTAPKGLVMRAVGPGLAAFGLSTAHPDPRVELYDSTSTLIATNDNWSGDDGESSGAFALAPGSKDAVLVKTLAPGGYTLHVLGAAGTSGVVLVELYEGRPPGTPGGLATTAGNTAVSLNWTATPSAVSYNVKRATVSGGPYTTIASATTNSYADTGLTNGTTYYYVVSAVNTIGESSNSTEASGAGSASAPPPLVYAAENTGASFSAPPLPTVSTATSIPPLPDPFTWGSDPTNQNGTRATAFSSWEHHRNETRAYVENYEIGAKPVVDPNAQVTASYANNTLTVLVTVNGQALTLTCPISIPAGATPPYQVCIGMNSAYGSLTSADFTSRGIASVLYSHNQVTTYNNPQATDPFYRLYPTLWGNSGQYSAWAWGVSRIIDGLVQVTNSGALSVDLNHICVTGCSYAGKMALYSGAFDERVALTVAQESGGGGDTAWRYSATEASGTVEGIPQTSHQWFSPALFAFGGGNEKFLPYDQHMLMAMCAPRALYCTANTDYTWLSNPSAYVCGLACAQTYATLGIADRFGFNVDGGHTHCMFPSDQEADLQYFLDRFIKGNTSLSKTIRTAPASFSTINATSWTAWWGTTNPVMGP